MNVKPAMYIECYFTVSFQSVDLVNDMLKHLIILLL